MKETTIKHFYDGEVMEKLFMLMVEYSPQYMKRRLQDLFVANCVCGAIRILGSWYLILLMI